MKNIITVSLLCVLLISCSKDDSEKIEEQNPTIEYISTNNVAGGDILTLNGSDLDPSHNYIIRFNDIEGEIIEITSRFIRVQIPENATSGDITFTYNGETSVVGEFTIKTSSENSSFLYAVKDFPGYSNSTVTQFVKIDPANGNETVLFDFQNNQLIESLVFDTANNTIIGISYTEDENGNISNALHVIDISANTVNTIELSENVYYELSISNEGKLFAVKDAPGYSNSTSSKLVEINPTTGSETVLLDLGTNHLVESLVYDNDNSAIYGVSSVEDENGNVTNNLFSIDIVSNTFSTMSLSDNFYYEFALSDEGKLFAIKDSPGYTNTTSTKLIEINTTSGNETELLDLETSQFVESLIFDNQNNKVIGISSLTDDNDNISNGLFIIDPTAQTFTQVDLMSDVYYELCYSN
ncbi:IPT/TIG domain-containing protein [Salinimicrobium sp. CAU 1759]